MKHFTIELNGTESTLTAYLHDQSPKMLNVHLRPAMLVIPGGGYQFCSDREAEPIAAAYFANGYNTFVLRYSVGEDRPFQNALKDGEEAVKHIRQNEKEYNLISENLAAVGFSAGGHLVASLATVGVNKPDAVILGYAVLTNQYGALVGTDMLDTTKEVNEKTPPSFIFATSDDPVVTCDNSISFAGAMAKFKRPFELHIFEKGVHGLSLCTKETANGNDELINSDVEKWFNLSLAFLQRQFNF